MLMEVDDRIFAIGGTEKPSSDMFDNVEEYHYENNTWNIVDEVPLKMKSSNLQFFMSLRTWHMPRITYVSERLSEELRVPRARPDARTRNLSERLPRHKL